MRNLLAAIVTGVLMFVPQAAFAGEQTVTLKVSGMTCASCPYQVQTALKRVTGVKAARASLKKGSAVVTFDDALTNIAALIKATGDAGFPSELDQAATLPSKKS